MLPSLNGIKDRIWSLDTAPKIKILLWKVISGALPVADNLVERGMKIDTRCQIRGLEGESLNHVLFTCTIARQTKTSLILLMGLILPLSISTSSMF